MKLFSEIKSLIYKDILLEWRQKYAFNGILLYIASTVFVVYLAVIQVEPKIWLALFWIIMLFASVNAIAKSFLQENRGRLLYYYSIASPQAIIISKIIYNIFLMLILSIICIGIYSLVVGNPVKNFLIFMLTVILGGIGFSLTFTMISAIVSKANNNSTLMAILSFPIIIPIIKILIQLSALTLLPQIPEMIYKDIFLLLSIDAIVTTVAILLFPYLWRD